MPALRALTLALVPFALGLVATSPALAQSARTRSAKTPGDALQAFLGRWELDLTRMPATYGPPPKRVTYAFAPAGEGFWSATIDIVARDGSVRHMAVRFAPDGRAFQGTGDRSEADSAAFGMPSPRVLVMGLAKDGRLGSVRTYAVSGDGRTMTESATNVDGEGAPFVRNFHYRRLP